MSHDMYEQQNQQCRTAHFDVHGPDLPTLPQLCLSPCGSAYGQCSRTQQPPATELSICILRSLYGTCFVPYTAE